MEWDISRAGIRAAAERRARIHRWQAPGRARVVHPARGSVVVPHSSNLAAILNAAEGMGLRLDRDPGRKGVGGPWRKGGPNAYII
mgnify:CR=1 FL=1